MVSGTKKVKNPSHFRNFNRVESKFIRADYVYPHDYNSFSIAASCECCSHFDRDAIKCTIGYNAQNHLASRQAYTYHLSGRIAFCRFIELD